MKESGGRRGKKEEEEEEEEVEEEEEEEEEEDEEEEEEEKSEELRAIEPMTKRKLNGRTIRPKHCRTRTREPWNHKTIKLENPTNREVQNQKPEN